MYTNFYILHKSILYKYMKIYKATAYNNISHFWQQTIHLFKRYLYQLIDHCLSAKQLKLIYNLQQSELTTLTQII